MLTRDPGFPVSALTGMYPNDQRLRVPDTFINAVLARVDAITLEVPR